MQALGRFARSVHRTSQLASHLTSRSTTAQARNARTFSTSQSLEMIYPGGCYCKQVRYEIDLEDADKARTSICHCKNCKKFTGGNFGITSKIPKSSFTVKSGQDVIKVHEADNGSGTLLHREFCGNCGSGLLEYGAKAGDFIYIFYGTLDNPPDLPPKGEFFCKVRDPWMPEVQGLFQKREIFE